MNSLGKCAYCGSEAKKKCGNCKSVWYCCKEHQKSDWKEHRHMCAASYHHHPDTQDNTGAECSALSKDDAPSITCNIEDFTIPTEEEFTTAVVHQANLKKKNGFCRGNVEFFVDVRIYFNLLIQTDIPPIKIPGTSNLICHPGAKIVKCTASDIHKNCSSPLHTKLDYLVDSELYKLTRKELKLCVLKGDQIKMQSGIIYKTAIGKKYFSLKDLVDIVVKDEQGKRANVSNYWFGGIDVHSIVFEGLKYKNGVYIPHWSP